MRAEIFIRLDIIAENYRQIRKRLPPNVKTLCVVKADAYGHGAVRVARRLESLGVESLGVATVNEGIELRDNDIKAPILVMSGILPWDEIEPFRAYMLTPVVYHFDGLKRLEGYLSKRGSKMKVHIKFDTGMGRLGFMKEDASILIDNLKRQDAIYVEGLMSHFSSSEKRDEYGLNQVKMFKEIIGLFKDNGVSLEVVHMANTGAIINYPEAHFDMVRIGIGLYGSSPSIELRDVLGLSQVMKVVSRIAFIKDFDVGYLLSYGRTYTTEKKTRVAYVPVGYSDGYPRALSNKAKVLVNGRRCNLIGRVCMDWLLVDITEIDSAYSGDEVILLGRGDGDTITADELAVLADTIPYEVLCNISKRIPKTYV